MATSIVRFEAIVKATPQENLDLLLRNFNKHLKALDSPKIIGQGTLDSLTVSIDEAVAFNDGLEEFLTRGRAETESAWKRILPDEELEVRTSIIWPKRQKLALSIKAAKDERARFNAEVQRKLEEDQRQKEAEQERINKKAAEDAAKAARAQGADRATVKEIKQAVLATPAPQVQKKIETPQNVSVRYVYSARVVNLKSLLGAALNDVTLFGILNTERVRAAMESELRSLATRQKDAFKIPGCELDKKATDVQR